MSLPYLLFNLQSGNVMAAFACESDALDALRDAANEDGLESIENLSLLLMEDGHPTLIAMEEELIRRVTARCRRVVSFRVVSFRVVMPRWGATEPGKTVR